MAARPSQAQLLQPNARPGNASVQGGRGGGAVNGRGAGRGRGGGSGAAAAAATASGDEGVSQQSRSVGDSTSITIMAAVRFRNMTPPAPYSIFSSWSKLCSTISSDYCAFRLLFSPFYLPLSDVNPPRHLRSSALLL